MKQKISTCGQITGVVIDLHPIAKGKIADIDLQNILVVVCNKRNSK